MQRTSNLICVYRACRGSLVSTGFELVQYSYFSCYLGRCMRWRATMSKATRGTRTREGAAGAKGSMTLRGAATQRMCVTSVICTLPDLGPPAINWDVSRDASTPPEQAEASRGKLQAVVATSRDTCWRRRVYTNAKLQLLEDALAQWESERVKLLAAQFVRSCVQSTQASSPAFRHPFRMHWEPHFFCFDISSPHPRTPAPQEFCRPSPHNWLRSLSGGVRGRERLRPVL